MAKKDELVEGVINETAEEMVKIKLFKDGSKYKDDVFVSRNGVNYLIQRGIEVEVPKGIAEILENQERMDNIRAEKIRQAREKANKE